MSGTFFLGLGGQKCGSSWYRAYLARAAGSDFGRLGEYQAWEADLGGVFARYRVPTPNPVTRLAARAKVALGRPIPRYVLRWQMQRDRAAYFDYFAGLLDRPGVQRTGDVTPSYAALGADGLARIRDGFADRGIAVKVIFAMRDPVARLRSHLRMDQDKGYRAGTGDEVADLAAFYASPDAEARSRYDATLEALEAVFEPEARHVCLMEEMTTEAGCAALSAFAGIPVDPGARSQMVNTRGQLGTSLPDDLVTAITGHYGAVYAAVARRMPQVAEHWPSARERARAR